MFISLGLGTILNNRPVVNLYVGVNCVPSTLLKIGSSALVEKAIWGVRLMEKFGIINTQLPPVLSKRPPPVWSCIVFLYLKEILGLESVFRKANWSEKLRKTWTAYKQIDTPFDLIIAGRKGDSFDDVLKAVGDSKNIILMTDVSSYTLGLLYDKSEYCIYPSEYEGFGIPILEAFSYGKTVATSNVSSMPEVGGDAAEYFDPQSVTSIKDSIVRLNNKEFRQVKEHSIKNQLKKFESARLIKQYEDMYNSL